MDKHSIKLPILFADFLGRRFRVKRKLTNRRGMKNLSDVGQELKALSALLFICQIDKFAQGVGRFNRPHADFAEMVCAHDSQTDKVIRSLLLSAEVRQILRNIQ